MIQKTVAVTANQHIAGANYKMRLAEPEISAAAQPGQFVMIRPDDGLNPFLPRPFSIHRIYKEAGELELLYKVVGDGTRHMTGLAAGDRLSLTGPLGKGFRLDRPVENVALVGGGIGVAPLVFLADVMAAGSFAPDRISVFVGGATSDDVLCQDDFAGLKMDARVATDDGSAGYRGLVTALLEQETQKELPDMIFACGPPAMLRAVAAIAATRDIPCQVSIETIMACGMGACLGCAVKSTEDSNSYKHACRDGPVFFAGEIEL